MPKFLILGLGGSALEVEADDIKLSSDRAVWTVRKDGEIAGELLTDLVGGYLKLGAVKQDVEE